MGSIRRAGWTIGGVLILLLVVAGIYQWRECSANRVPLTDTSVMVAAKPPADAFFPIEFLITNDFQLISGVRVSCIVDRFVTDEVDLVDTEAAGREDVPAIARGAQRPFACPAPAELRPPFRLDAVRRAHVTVDVVFSVPGRRQPLGVRQAFDLVGDPVRRRLWQPVTAVLSR
jgi:hypothetical protein